MAKRSWKTVHKSSGATVIERHAKGGCKLTVIPSDATRPKGAAVWSTTCGGHSSKSFAHKRGNSSTVSGAKKAATRAVRTLQKRRKKGAR